MILTDYYQEGWAHIYDADTGTKFASINLTKDYAESLKGIVGKSDRYVVNVNIETKAKAPDKSGFNFSFKCADCRLVGRIAKEVATINVKVREFVGGGIC